jgi:hypothetical protein
MRAALKRQKETIQAYKPCAITIQKQLQTVPEPSKIKHNSELKI